MFNPSRSHVDADSLKCHHPDCKGKPPFKRSQDRRRHEITIHKSPRSYVCPYNGCYEAKNRKDNLKEHIRRHHQEAMSAVRSSRSTRSSRGSWGRNGRFVLYVGSYERWFDVGHGGHGVEGHVVTWKQINGRVGVVSFLSEICISTYNNRIGCYIFSITIYGDLLL